MALLRHVQIPTERLLLRRFFLGEVDDFVAYRNDPYVLQYQPWLSPLTPGDAWNFMTRQVAATLGTPGTQVHMAIVIQTTAQIVGDCFLKVDPSGRYGEVGIMIAREWLGRGVEEEALRALMFWAYTEMRIQRLTAIVDPRNAGLATALIRLRFSRVSSGLWGGRFQYDTLAVQMGDHPAFRTKLQIQTQPVTPLRHERIQLPSSAPTVLPPVEQLEEAVKKRGEMRKEKRYQREREMRPKGEDGGEVCKTALRLAKSTASKESVLDSGLFNRESLSGTFAVKEAYHLYDQPLFHRSAQPPPSATVVRAPRPSTITSGVERGTA